MSKDIQFYYKTAEDQYSSYNMLTNSQQSFRDTNNLPIVGNNAEELLQYTANMYFPSIGAKSKIVLTIEQPINELLLFQDVYAPNKLVLINNIQSSLLNSSYETRCWVSLDGGISFHPYISNTNNTANISLNGLYNGVISDNYFYGVTPTNMIKFALPTDPNNIVLQSNLNIQQQALNTSNKILFNVSTYYIVKIEVGKNYAQYLDKTVFPNGTWTNTNPINNASGWTVNSDEGALLFDYNTGKWVYGGSGVLAISKDYYKFQTNDWNSFNYANIIDINTNFQNQVFILFNNRVRSVYLEIPLMNNNKSLPPLKLEGDKWVNIVYANGFIIIRSLLGEIAYCILDNNTWYTTFYESNINITNKNNKIYYVGNGYLLQAKKQNDIGIVEELTTIPPNYYNS